LDVPRAKDVCKHWSVSSRTVREYAEDRGLRFSRVNREYRFEWPDIWAFEQGARPPSAQQERYMTPLATKRTLALATEVSVRTVDRWIARGLPTRNVASNVRFNIYDAAEWLERHQGVNLHTLTRKLLALHERPRKQPQFVYRHDCANGAETPRLSREQSANKHPSSPDAPANCGRRARDGDPT
jgi:DNA-binding transcriptional MerR regulator